MRKLTAFFIAALMIISLSACKNKKDEQVKYDYPVDVRGVTIKSCPQNVISLSPAITDIIYALGSDAQLIGVSDYCIPEKELPRFGSSALPDTNDIIGSNADLILASSAMPDLEKQRLEAKKKTVVIIPSGATYNELLDIYKNVAMAMSGKITGSKNAENTFSRIDARIKTVKNKLAGKSQKACLLLGNQVAATPDTFAGELLSFAGAENAAKGGVDYALSYQKIAEANPSFIFCPQDMLDAVKADEQLKQTDAVKNGRVIAISPFYFERQGENLALGVEIMAASMFPDIIQMPTLSSDDMSSSKAIEASSMSSAATPDVGMGSSK